MDDTKFGWIKIFAVVLMKCHIRRPAARTCLFLLMFIGITVVFFTLIMPALLFPHNRAVVDTTGSFQISSKAFTYVDTSRVEGYTDTGENRKLNVQFWYPDMQDGRAPLVVFSHGGLGTRSSNESLYSELASHGYVVCSIDHTYQCFFTDDADGRRIWIDSGYVKELLTEDAQSDKRQSLEYYQKWMEIRTGDMNFVIDRIVTEAEKNDADLPYQLVDPGRIGVMGHSLGGSAALGLGRMRDDVSAVIALESPFMNDIEGVENGRFVFTGKVYPVPVLNIYSDSSWNILAKRPQYAANFALLSDTSETTDNVYISGVGHLGLTDFALTSPRLTRILDRQKSTTQQAVTALKMINRLCLGFFNKHLKK